ncbi:hypothetical protein [Ferrovibrio sp.]|uniref:hypothetical protein n=1 Tax=Ferrovibrio sp. TaxID=1917215 RepID=UPI003D0C7074
MALRWHKKPLSRTDAQQPTRGYRVPYLRFTKSKNPQNVQIWFRNTFFAGMVWTNGFFGNHAVEETSVRFRVTILGVFKGNRMMKITHDSNRCRNHNTPNTWLHYDDATLADFAAQNLAGRAAEVLLDINGNYHFNIS